MRRTASGCPPPAPVDPPEPVCPPVAEAPAALPLAEPPLPARPPEATVPPAPFPPFEFPPEDEIPPPPWAACVPPAPFPPFEFPPEDEIPPPPWAACVPPDPPAAEMADPPAPAVPPTPPPPVVPPLWGVAVFDWLQPAKNAVAATKGRRQFVSGRIVNLTCHLWFGFDPISSRTFAGLAFVRSREVREESLCTRRTYSLRHGCRPEHRSIHCCRHSRSSRHLARSPLRAGRRSTRPCRLPYLRIRCFPQQVRRFPQQLRSLPSPDCRLVHCCPRLPSPRPSPRTMSSRPWHCSPPCRHCHRVPWVPRRCAFPRCRSSRPSRFPLRRRRCLRDHPRPSSRPRLHLPQRPSRHQRLRHRMPSREPCFRGWSWP